MRVRARDCSMSMSLSFDPILSLCLPTDRDLQFRGRELLFMGEFSPRPPTIHHQSSISPLTNHHRRTPTKCTTSTPPPPPLTQPNPTT